jgi:hypothetical protein
MTRQLFLLGLALLLIAALGTATLATRAAPRQGLVAELPAGTLAQPERLDTLPASQPTPESQSGAGALWLTAALLTAAALGAVLLVLRPRSAPSSRQTAPSREPLPSHTSGSRASQRREPLRWGEYLLLAVLVVVTVLGVLSLLGSKVAATFSTINSGLAPVESTAAPLPAGTILPAAGGALLAVVDAEAIVYAEATLDSAVVDVLRPGEQVRLSERTANGRWVYGLTPRTRKGWVLSRLVRLSVDKLAALPAAEAGDSPDEPSAEGPPSRTVIRADWPARLEVGQPDTVTVRLLNEELLASQPTVGPGHTALVEEPLPVGTPEVSLPRAFGSRYTACATAWLMGEGLASAELLSPAGCRPIDANAVEWTWRVAADQEATYAPWVRIDVTWTPTDGGAPITRTVWRETIRVEAERVLVGSAPLRALSLASAGLGTVLTAPLAYRRGRERWLEQPSVEVRPSAPPPQPPSTHLPPAPPEPPPAPPQAVPDRMAQAGEGHPPPSPHLNLELKGVGPDESLTVGQAVSLFVWVGEQLAAALNRASQPFAFRLADEEEPVAFTVRVIADPACWRIEVRQPTLVVRPPGATDQAAVFRITPLQAGTDKLFLTVERADTGAVVQDVCFRVTAEAREAALQTGAMAGEEDTRTRVVAPAEMAELRLAAFDPRLKRRQVRLRFDTHDAESFDVVVDAELPGERVHQVFTMPITGAAIQNTTLRLRRELEQVVLFQLQDGGQTLYPFADPYRLTVDEAIARQAVVPLARAGKEMWRQLFDAPDTPDGLKRLAAELREIPRGSAIQIVLESKQFIVPWALLYDRPGPVTAETLDWAGFWGYRFILDVLPLGDYPDTLIAETPRVKLLFHDDPQLRQFTEEQLRVVREELKWAPTAAAWGSTQVRQALEQPLESTLLYVFCHGQHDSAAELPGALPSDSALMFSAGDRLDLAELRDTVRGRLAGRPLVFLNACEGATQDAFFYDGFMPFFIQECGARGLIGAEVKLPQLLAHDAALRFMRLFAEGVQVGEALWRLRRHYLDAHHNPMAFNYTLYGLDEVQLAHPLIPPVLPN